MGRRGRPVSGAQKRTKLGSSVPSSLMSWQGRRSWWEGFDPVAVGSDPTTNWGPSWGTGLPPHVQLFRGSLEFPPVIVWPRTQMAK